MRKCVDVAGSQSFHYGKKTHRYEMLRGRREPFGKGLEREVLVRTQDFMGFPGRSVGKKNPPAMQETLVGFLGLEDPLQKG